MKRRFTWIILILSASAMLLVFIYFEKIAFRTKYLIANYQPLSWTKPLPSATHVPDESLLPSILSLNAFLHAQGSTLDIVVLPLRDSVFSDPSQRELRKKPHLNSLRAWNLLHQLEAHDIRAHYPLEAVARAATATLPQPFFLDQQHYLHGGKKTIASLIASQGDFPLLIGDCHAASIAKSCRNIGLKAQSLGRNAGGYRMAAELPLLPQKFLPPGSKVTWLIMDDTLDEHFPSAPANSRLQQSTASKTVVATITTFTPPPTQPLKSLPYPNLLTAQVFTPIQGDPFIAITYAIKERKLLPGVDLWKEGSEIVLQLIPWQESLTRDPTLVNEALADKTDRWDLPRYYISNWFTHQSLPDQP